MGGGKQGKGVILLYRALFLFVFLLLSSHQLFAEELPLCSEREPPVTEQELDEVIAARLVEFPDVWFDDWIPFFEVVSAGLGCRFMTFEEVLEAERFFESGFEQDEIISEQIEGAAQATEECACTDIRQRAYCGCIQYCGPGDSGTDSRLDLYSPSLRLNRLCYNHDRCYGRQCLAADVAP